MKRCFFLVVALLCTSGMGWGAVTVDVNVSADQSPAAVTVQSPPFSTATGNELLLAFVATDYISGANTIVSGVAGAGLTWQLVARTNVQSGSSEIWRAFAPSALANVSVTATLSHSVVSSITVMSFSGVDTSGTAGSGAIGATASQNSRSGAPTASVVTKRNGSLIFAVGNDYDRAVARTPGANQSIVHQYLTPTGDTYWVQMLNAPVPLANTTATINDTAPTADRYNFTVAEVMAASITGTGFNVTGSISPSSLGNGALITLSQN